MPSRHDLAGIPDWVMYSFFSGPAESNYGPTMSDWTTFFGNTKKFSMPDSCSYQTWLATGTCSLEYTGLQPLLNSDITIRVQLSACPGSFALPSLTIDCSGNACPIISDPVPCTQDYQCPTGTVCYNPAASLLVGSIVDPLAAFLNLGASNPLNVQNSCCGSGYFEEDVASLVNNITGYSSSPLQFCFWDVKSLFNSFDTGNSNANWITDQTTANGNTVSSIYIQNWIPSNAGPPASAGTLTFTIVLSINSPSIEALEALIISILVQCGYDSTTFTVTVVFNSKRSTTATVTVTSPNSEITDSMGAQLNTPSSVLAQNMMSQVGTYSSVITQTARGTTLVASVFVIFVALFILW